MNQKAAVCCLAAVASVGVQYNADAFEAGTDGVFYDVARHFFENLMEEKPLDAIKTCSVLAMYNIMNKATVSLAYLGLRSRYVLECSQADLVPRYRSEHVQET